ncbi:MAG TPA: SpoIIE family protein phosphatase [Solirubrobacteraceae bacterium]|jgi:PAS domain S-box-containing protein|nr:SpoIIE family protein phosphatase [Solirubrobacteraceae bacterium]
MGDTSATDLLVEAGAVLASSLDPRVTMRQVALLTVPRLGDLCVIDLRNEAGEIRDVAVVATDPAVEAGLIALREEHPVDPQEHHPVAEAIRSGEPVLLQEMSDELLRAIARGPAHAAFMIASEYRSAIVAPLPARGRMLGAISVLRLGECEPFAQADLDIACELARRAALAIDNARLFSELRAVEQRLEAILVGLAEAVTVVERGGRTVFANRAASDLLGFDSSQELVESEPGSIMRRFIVLDEDGRELELTQMPARRLFAGETEPPPLLVRNISRGNGRERWLIVRATPIRDAETGEVTHAVNVFEDITEVKRAERAERLLAEASRILASSLDYGHTLRRVARLAVPQLADWCSVSVLEENNEIRRVAVHSTGDGPAAQAQGLERVVAPQLGDTTGVGAVIRTGRSRRYGEGSRESIEDLARSDEHLELLREMGARTMVFVPMAAAGRTVGSIALVSSDPLRRIGDAEVALAEELGRRAGTAVHNARAFTERALIAHTLQQALLPSALPSAAGVEVHALYEAAGELNEVGGDFYDILEEGESGSWLLMVGDVCGKGAHAAAATALARHTLRAAALGGGGPAAMLQALHTAMRLQPTAQSLCTAAIVRMTRSADGGARLDVALGGHQPPLLIDPGGGTRAIGRTGTLLGVVDPIEVHEVEVAMALGDTLLLYTDGVTDAGHSTDRLGEEGLAQLCAQSSGESLEALLERIRAAALERVSGRSRDDIMLLGMRLSGS